MHLEANEKTLPRIHLIGTIGIVLALTLALAGFFSWQNYTAYRASLQRIEESAQDQIQMRLATEMESAIGMIAFARSQTDSVLRNNLAQQVDTVMEVVKAIHTQESGHRSVGEIQRLITETLRPIRFFNGRGYVHIQDRHARQILMPIAPQLEGSDISGKRDDHGVFITRRLAEVARKPAAEGYLRYRWHLPDNPGQMADKLSYVRHFEPYDWVIGTGDYLHNWEDHQRSEARIRLRSIRFGNTGYAVAMDRSGKVLLTPANPDLEGRHYSELPSHEQKVFELFSRTAHQGGGFVHYEWPDPKTGRKRSKTALVRNYHPWGWVLVTTLFDDEMQQLVADETGKYQALGARKMAGVALAVLAALGLALAGSLLFSRWMRSLFRTYHQRNLEQQNALRESKRRLNTILDGVEGCIYIKGTDYRYLYANRKTCSLFGLPAHEIKDHSDADFFGAEVAARMQETDRRVIQGGEKIIVEDVYTRRDGSLATDLSIKIPLQDESGRIYALCGISTDITVLKQTQAEIEHYRQHLQHLVDERTRELAEATEQIRLNEERYEYAMQAASDGIWDWCIQTGKTYTNPAYGKMLGFMPGELGDHVSQCWMDLLPPDEQEEMTVRIMKQFEETGSSENEFRMRCKDGSYKWILSRGMVVTCDGDGRPIRAVGTHVDLTTHKQIEQQLREAKEAAEAANRAKSSFLANMSHEIRTPMSAIIGMTYLALKAAESGQRHGYLLKIQKSSQHLLGVLNDILDFSKIEAGKLAVERIEFDLNMVLDEITAVVGERATAKNLSLGIEVGEDVPSHLLGDPLRIGQVLINFTNNAVKFTEHGEIALCITVIEQGGDEVVLQFRVRDSGIGIAPEQIGSLFQSFQQADTAITRRYGGTGLGLVIARRLVELMGGEVGVESMPGQGSTFWFTIPLGKCQAGSQPIQASPQPSLAGLAGARALLVEDNEFIQEMLSRLLEEAGIEVCLAEDGAAALDMLQQHHYEVVLMDMQMPVMDGLTATRLIRRLPGFERLPIIAITANALAGDRERCLEAGMSDYLTKPVDRTVLLAKLQQWITPRALAADSKTVEIRLPSPALHILDGIAGLDARKGANMVGSDAIYLDMLKKFAGSGADAAEKIDRAIVSSDWETARRIAHMLKGTAGQIGAQELRNSAEKLEQAARQGETGATIETLQRQLDVSLRELVGAIGNRLQ